MPQTSVIVPDKGIRAVRNSTGADLAAGVFVQLVPAGTEDPYQVRLPSAGGGKTLGVTMNIIKNGQIGDVQVEGRTRVLAGAGGIAAGADVASTTAGAAVTAATGNYVGGVCVRAAAAGDLGEVELPTATSGRIAP